MRCSVAAGFPGASTVLPSAPRASRTLLFGPSKTTPQELVFLMSANEAQASSCSQGVDVCVCVHEHMDTREYGSVKGVFGCLSQAVLV